MIDARSCGKGSNLAIIHRYNKPDGSVGEGTYRRLELSNEWHEYYVPMVATKGGKARLDFPLALNDETGIWTLCVSEPLTGVSAEQTFAVK